MCFHFKIHFSCYIRFVMTISNMIFNMIFPLFLCATIQALALWPGYDPLMFCTVRKHDEHMTGFILYPDAQHANITVSYAFSDRPLALSFAVSNLSVAHSTLTPFACWVAQLVCHHRYIAELSATPFACKAVVSASIVSIDLRCRT